MAYPLSYVAEEHDPLIIKLFEQCEGVAAFCSEADINQDTFYQWLKDHPSFKESYKKAISRGLRAWERVALKGQMSDKLWHLIAKQRYKFDMPRITRASEGAKATERVINAWKDLEEGEVTIDEANKLATLAQQQVQIEDRVPASGMNTLVCNRNQLLNLIDQKLAETQENDKATPTT